ncbi:MAG: hypothetical protein HY390_06745 [Deltaproteobacteria bacterium]|nr:hypothetical protein [Deltaproteobacteria bacterium]
MKQLHNRIVSLSVLAMMVWMLGCGDEKGAEQKKPSLPGNLQTQVTGIAPIPTVLLENATHVFQGTVTVTSETEFKLIAASDYTGKLKQTPRIRLDAKINSDGFMETAKLLIISEDELGIMRYEAKNAARWKFCGLYTEQGQMRLSLQDHFGFIDFFDDSADGKFQGMIYLDGKRNKVLGNFELEVQKLEQKPEVQE